MLGGFPPLMDLPIALLKTQSTVSLCANTYRVSECLAVQNPVTSTEGKRALANCGASNTFLHEGNHQGRAPGRASFDAVPQMLIGKV